MTTLAANVKRSLNNPFRSQPVTPNPTGAGPSGQPSGSIPDPQPERGPQSETHQTVTTTTTATTMPSAAASSIPRERERERRSADDLADELRSTALDDDNSTPAEPPPAYTPSANPYEGEATVEYGPHRPFQPAPPPPPLPQQFTGMSGMSDLGPPLHPQYSGMPPGGPSPYMTPQATGMPIRPAHTEGWSSYPGQAPAPNSSSYYGPPPRHPQLSGNGYAISVSPAVNIGPMPSGNNNNNISEFARDFYASSPVDRVPSPVPSRASSEDAGGPEHFERARPSTNASSSSVPSSSNFAPPPGPPPSGAPSSPPSSSRPPNGPPPSRTSSNNTDDLKPTTTPTPGRPLLNKGRILVYPIGHECKKCLNTGYKQFDPSHPCKKCWEKYSKPYSGAMVYAPHSPQSQRPLPNLKPPQLGHQPSQSQSQPFVAGPSPSGLLRTQSAYRPCSSPFQGGYPGRPLSSPCTGSGFGRGPGGFVSPQLSFTRGVPPPGSLVVRPGDARIGGRLCWRCDGTGTVSFLIFDVEQCPVCNGVGRVFQ